MKKGVYNPFLPLNEYVPDTEAHVFGDKVYLYGSHDQFGGKKFCMNDYVCWSAPIDDLSDWKFEGEIYKRTQDPENVDGKYELWAPDVTKGPDGRYYLYYCLSDRPAIGVAVCDSPAGEYAFYGHVHDQSGQTLGTRQEDTNPFDPAVLMDDDGRVWLYSGNGPLSKKADKEKKKASMVMELLPDMLTLKSEPKPLIPTLHTSVGTDFEGHEFFEASSIRKFNGKYYFAYSSVQCHFLCWAVSDYPDRDFAYGGALVSNGGVSEKEKIDTGFNAKPDKRVKYYIGNNHGSVEFINGKYYVFYHRQTNRRMSSRQSCAEPIRFENGRFLMAENSSCGLNGGVLPAEGKFPAGIACHLQSKGGAVFSAHPMVQNKKHPAITQIEMPGEENPIQIIENMKEGASAGFRSFQFSGPTTISVSVRTKAGGTLQVLDEENGNTVAEILIPACKEWKEVIGELKIMDGIHPLYFVYHGKGSLDMASFTLT